MLQGATDTVSAAGGAEDSEAENEGEILVEVRKAQLLQACLTD